jgi:hypothetical protein
MRPAQAMLGTLAFLVSAFVTLPPASVAGGGGGGGGNDCDVHRCAMEAAVSAVCTPTAHKPFVKCVAKLAKQAGMQGVCRKSMIHCAVKSTAGRPGSVACITKKGRCKIVKSDDDCTSKGGTVGDGDSCCTPCPNMVQCCLSSSATGAFVGDTCQVLTADQCDTLGGDDAGPGTCDPNPCEVTGTTTTTTPGGSSTTTTATTLPGTVQCCVPSSGTAAFITSKHAVRTCEVVTPEECASRNGDNVGPGSCTPDPCASTTTTTVVGGTTTTIVGGTTTTTVVGGTTTTTIPGGGGCCPAGRISTTTAEGTLVVGTLTAFPFPAGVKTTLDVDAGDATCKHNVIIPANGFSVPIFCIPALNFTSQVTPLGCESGGAFGNGVLWDAAATGADADVSTVGDTSDGTCNPAGQPCSIASGGASNNTLGDIDTTVGDGNPDPAGVQAAVAIPVDSLTWSAADASCPDADGTFNDGVDTQISRFQFILRPTTATANAAFVDKNGDGCSRGTGTAGPNSTRVCANDHSKPCGSAADCPGSTCGAGAMQGSPPAGPCCVAGQNETLVATGIAFSGGSPLFDLIFSNLSPTSVDSCAGTPGADTCTLSTDPCKQ